jgi:hypothetical protein
MNSVDLKSMSIIQATYLTGLDTEETNYLRVMVSIFIKQPKIGRALSTDRFRLIGYRKVFQPAMLYRAMLPFCERTGECRVRF